MSTKTETRSDRQTETLYQQVLNDTHVCDNCFRLKRSPSGWRNHSNTTIEYTVAKNASDRRGTFCRCGHEDYYYRSWPDRLTPDRQKELFTQLAESLDRLHHDVVKPVVFHHLVRYLNETRSEGEFDEWLHQRLPDITED